MPDIENVTHEIEDKNIYHCTLSFTTEKNLSKIFQDKKFLRIISLNNMITGHNNIFIIREKDDIEAEISNLELGCSLKTKYEEDNKKLRDELIALRQENKSLNNIVNKIKSLFL